jgi:hypothetical protein
VFFKKKGMIDEYVVDFDEYAGLGSGSIGYLDGVAYAIPLISGNI